MNIVVLCGGVSSEREISLKTSAKVSRALSSRGHRVVMVDVFFGSDQELSFDKQQDYEETAHALRAKKELICPELIRSTGLFGPNVLPICRKADVVFIGLHGENGEDGKVQAAFDREGIRYTGSDAASSALAMSKDETKKLVSQYIRMPRGIVVRKLQPGSKISVQEVLEKISVPCVVKPSNGGSSLGVFHVKEDSQLESAIETCFRYDDTLLIEEYIEGRELTQGVLDGRALPPVEICPDDGDWYDYTNKYNGETREICPAQIPEEVLAEMSKLSVQFGQILGLSVYYRIDYILDRQGNLYALEANSLPGMTDTSLVPQEAAAIGMSYPELCEKIIELSLAGHDR